MALEYVVGPVLALLVSLKFSDMQLKKQQAQVDEVNQRIEAISKVMDDFETEVPKKMMATMLPVAKAVQKLSQQVGLWM